MTHHLTRLAPPPIVFVAQQKNIDKSVLVAILFMRLENRERQKLIFC